jgi:predicted glutamine amidotransferase
MCELFAMSANRPTGVGRYLSRLMPCGGRIGPHADGWGVAYYEGRAARIFKDPAPAAESRFLAMLTEDLFESTAVIAHIRKANPSTFGRATANTHPFERACNGRSWVFAHNGKLPGLTRSHLSTDSRFQPVGHTDSELAFCHILDAIARRTDRQRHPSPAVMMDTIRPVVEQLSASGEFNLILGDGDCLYVHAHTNLHPLQRSHLVLGEARTMILLATAPLTAEPWQALAPSSLHVFHQGEDIGSKRPAPLPQLWPTSSATLLTAPI